MQFLVSELAQEETDLLKPDLSYPVWSPYDATEAANTMLMFGYMKDSVIIHEDVLEPIGENWEVDE
jgi:hypothetical protein